LGAEWSAMSTPELNYALPQAAATDELGEGVARALLACGPVGKSDPAGQAWPVGCPAPVRPSGAAGPSGSVAPAGAVVHLRGELGAGKTALVRSLLRVLGVRGLIRSPTFTLVETYPLAGAVAVHVDLYRITGPRAVEELGLRDWMGEGALLLIEWPERGGTAVPPPDLDIELGYRDLGRRARVSGASTRGARLLDLLRNDEKLGAYLFNFA
jgi:tRNA threonylcarbamoyladenosine biosynthesis protein TsaE